jgi:hypothetical protein
VSAASSKVQRAVTLELARRHADATVPHTLAEAYLEWFKRGWLKHALDANERGADVVRLLQLLVAAREPPSLALLEMFGLRRALEALPGCVPPNLKLPHARAHGVITCAVLATHHGQPTQPRTGPTRPATPHAELVWIDF